MAGESKVISGGGGFVSLFPMEHTGADARPALLRGFVSSKSSPRSHRRRGGFVSPMPSGGPASNGAHVRSTGASRLSE